MSDLKPNPHALPLETSKDMKASDEKITLSIGSGSVSPVNLDDTALTVKDAFLGSTQQHAFSSPVNLEFWSNTYEKALYEGRHRFDPLFQWSPGAEKSLVRKVLPLPCSPFFGTSKRIWHILPLSRNTTH